VRSKASETAGDIDESAGISDSDEELPEEPDWAALEDNVPLAGSSTESENDDCELGDSRNFVRYM